MRLESQKVRSLPRRALTPASLHLHAHAAPPGFRTRTYERSKASAVVYIPCVVDLVFTSNSGDETSKPPPLSSSGADSATGCASLELLLRCVAMISPRPTSHSRAQHGYPASVPHTGLSFFLLLDFSSFEKASRVFTEGLDSHDGVGARQEVAMDGTSLLQTTSSFTGAPATRDASHARFSRR